MKRIICLCIILLCSISFAFAQRSRKPVVKTTLQFTEAEKAWTPFWNKFREAIKTKNRKNFYDTMPESFEYGFGIYKRKNIRSGEQNITEAFPGSAKDSISDDWWQELDRISSKGVTNILKKGNEISCYGRAKTLSKVSPNNWNNIANGESENFRFMLFEFRGNRWFFVALDTCETE